MAMVGSHLKFLALLLHPFASAVATDLQVASGHQDLEAARAHTRASKVKLRERSQGSHGLRASAFRAAAHGRSGRQKRFRQAPDPLALPSDPVTPGPLYVPMMGLANVTQPTPFPPPPPVLEPWKDHQPMDTAVGNFLIAGFIADPTATPPPTQASMDLAFACPQLVAFPSDLKVTVPYVCSSLNQGNWSDASGNQQMKWSTSCIDLETPGFRMPSLGPVTTYVLPQTGDHFGSSQDRKDAWGNQYTDIRDCGGAVVYQIEEKLYMQVGEPNDDACEDHKSCDGVVYLQWFIKDAQGKVIAQTPYTTIFQDAFDITDASGVRIATASRMGGWKPDNMPVTDEWQCPEDKGHVDNQPLQWQLRIEASPPGVWSTITAQWPLAVLLTSLSHRDMERQPDGSLLWSMCAMMKTSGYAFMGLAGLWCCICLPFGVFLACSAFLIQFMHDQENRNFPRRMAKPSLYG